MSTATRLMAIGRLVLVSVVALAACGSSRSSAANGSHGVPTTAWAVIAQGLEPGGDTVCTRGEPACVDAVVAEMRRRVDSQLATCDHLLPWTLIYLRVTETLVQLRHQSGAFIDPAWVTRLSAAFAELWFKADDAWQAHRREAMTPSWQAVYDAASAKQVSATGNLIMAMNAHISGDLPRALVSVTTPGIDHHPDFVRANQLFELNFSSGVAEVARRLDDTASTIVIPGIGEEQAVVAAITAWRDEAFANSQRLLSAGTDSRQSVLDSIDAVAAARAETIRVGTAYPPFTAAAATRDVYCAQHHAS